MKTRRILPVIGLLAIAGADAASAQSTSLRRRYATTTQPAQESRREADAYQGNPVLERHSLIAVTPVPPKQFKVHDLITIVVREQRTFEADGSLETKKRFEIQSELDAFIKCCVEGGVGASVFRRGKPNIDYKFGSRVKNEADKEREDRFTTRITAEIIDVKPNGTLVLQARGQLKFDDEVSVMTLTGTCRKEDVTPDNSILSTQLADKRISVENTGAVRDGSRRGWLTFILDVLRPI
jgi:flagellar L-ring protein precursor FlgH